jgi:hypothetical protein
MKRQPIRKVSLLLLTTIMMLIAALPAQVAIPRTAAAQHADDTSTNEISAKDMPIVDIAVGPLLRNHAGPVSASDLSEPDERAIVGDAVILEEEIVYVGEDERIYVLDTHQVDDNPLVKWVSPDGDWRSVDVGDFNNDGDMEIVAVGGNIDSGKMAVWDPVDRTGAPGLPTINGIPWQLLHQRLIPGRPSLVKAGNFDPNIPGDEILYGFKMQDEIKPEDDDEFRISIIKSGTPNPDGTNWVDHIRAKDDGNEWTYVESGDLGDGGSDEIALLDEDGGEVNVFRLADGFQRILGESSSSSPYRSVVIGDFFTGGYDEVIITRNEKFPDPSLFYYQYYPGEDDELKHADDQVEIITPYPRFVWVADVNNSGDDEVFMLRRDEGPRLFGRNHGFDPMPTLEANLDEDNGYRAGAGGDLDGDGNDEVVIIRDDRLRIYKNEEVRWTVEEFVISAETKVLRTGDLDGGDGGAVDGPEFVFSEEIITQSLEPDTSVQNREFTLSNGGSEEIINFTYQIPSAPSWVTVTTDSLQASAARPARVFVSFDAKGLTYGTYTASVVFSAISPAAINSPFTVPIELTVREAQITPSPATAYFDFYPCTDPFEASILDISIGGTIGLTYNAAIVDRPLLAAAQATLGGEIAAANIGADGLVTLEGASGDRATIDLPALEISASAVTSTTWPSGAAWATAVSQTNRVPDTLTVTVDPSKRGADSQQAVLVLVGDERAGDSPTNVKLIPLNLVCASGRAYLPSIVR